MQVTREYLLDLDKKRLKMEEEIISLTNFLNSEGMPGVEGKLIDDQGFPLPNIDIMAVRTARNKLILLQNDLKNLMISIEKNMQEYFKSDREKRIQEVAKEKWGLGIGDWGLGIGPNPQSPIPNPQSPFVSHFYFLN
jgi:hypothetical protein